MKAKKKPFLKMSPEELGVDIAPSVETLEVSEPPKRSGGRKVETVDEVNLRILFMFFLGYGTINKLT